MYASMYIYICVSVCICILTCTIGDGVGRGCSVESIRYDSQERPQNPKPFTARASRQGLRMLYPPKEQGPHETAASNSAPQDKAKGIV